LSIGFYLLGEFTEARVEPHECLRKLERRILADCSQLEPATRHGFLDEKSCLFCKLHPAAEEVQIALPDANHLTVSANTSTVGPGYHVFLCDLIHRWTQEFSIRWEQFDPDEDTTFGDETGYFFTGSQESVYGHMESWLRTLTGSFFDGTLDRDAKEIALCMPINVQFHADYLAITQLGPRDQGWLLRMSQGAIDYGEFFPWYNVGLDANYYLNRALVQMWSEVRWRKPATDTERRLLDSVLAALALAYTLNPEFDFPRNEWRDLLTLADREIPGHVREKASGAGRIGYRRNTVKTTLPGSWRIQTEGSFSDFEPDSDGSFVSVDPPREIWFTAYSFSANDPDQTFQRMRDKALGEKRELVSERENYVAIADVTTQRKYFSKYYLLKSSSVGVLCRSVLTIVFRDPSDRDWAIRVWKSLSPPAMSESKSIVQ